MKATIITLLITVAVALSLYLGRVMPMILPMVSPLFDHKPFNCRPCFTFHSVWLLVGVIALFFNSLEVFVVGVVVAFIVFGIVKYIDNKKIEE